MNSNNIRVRPLEAGSTILMSLVVMTVGTVGLASWISLLSARASQINNKENVLSHRIAELNSRSVVRESLYSVLTARQSSPRLIAMPNSDSRICASCQQSASIKCTYFQR